LRYTRALEILAQDPGVDAVLVMNCPTALASSLDVAQAIVGAIDRHRSTFRANKPVITNWLGEEASRGARELFAISDIATFAPPAASDGCTDLVRHARAQDELMRTPPSLPEDLGLDTAAASATLAAAIAAGRRQLSEVEAKQLLGAYGIATVPTEVASDADAV